MIALSKYASFLALCLPLILMAQKAAPASPVSQEDSLLTVYHALPDDTTKVNRYNSLAKKLLRSNPARAQDVADNAFGLAEDLAYCKGMCQALNYIGMANQSQGLMPEALASINQSLKIASKANDKYEKSQALHLLGNLLLQQNDYSTAVVYFQQALGIRFEIGDSTGIAKTYNNLGNVYSAQENPLEAINYYQKAALIFEKLKDEATAAVVYGNVSNQYASLRDFDQAESFAQRSLTLKKKYNDLRGIAYSYHNLAYIAKRKDNDSLALAYNLQAYEIFKKIDNGVTLAAVMVGIGDSYLELGHYAKALENYEAAQKIYREVDNQEKLAITYTQIAAVHERKGDLQTAANTFNQALNMAEVIESKLVMTSAAAGHGRVLVKQQRFAQAIATLTPCLAPMQAGEVSETEFREVYHQLSLAHAAMGSAAQAAEMMEKYQKISATLTAGQ